MTEDPAIIRLNLRHYRALLDLDISEEKRRRVEALIAEAEATLQAMVFFIDYLAAHSWLSVGEASRLQADYARLFEVARPGIHAGDAGARLYPSYETLVAGLAPIVAPSESGQVVNNR